MGQTISANSEFSPIINTRSDYSPPSIPTTLKNITVYDINREIDSIDNRLFDNAMDNFSDRDQILKAIREYDGLTSVDEKDVNPSFTIPDMQELDIMDVLNEIQTTNLTTVEEKQPEVEDDDDDDDDIDDILATKMTNMAIEEQPEEQPEEQSDDDDIDALLDSIGYKMNDMTIEEKEAPPENEQPTRECPPDKILNPATGRCVSRTGVIGKKLARDGDDINAVASSTTRRTTRECPPDKILNPATGRCVSRTGAIGKKLLAT